MELANVAERRNPSPLLVSAATGEGFDTLITAIEERVAANRVVFDLVLDPADGSGVNWLYRHAEVMSRAVTEDGRIAVKVRIDRSKASSVQQKFGAGTTA